MPFKLFLLLKHNWMNWEMNRNQTTNRCEAIIWWSQEEERRAIVERDGKGCVCVFCFVLVIYYSAVLGQLRTLYTLMPKSNIIYYNYVLINNYILFYINIQQQTETHRRHSQHTQKRINNMNVFLFFCLMRCVAFLKPQKQKANWFIQNL